MSPEEALHALEETEVVPCLEAPIAEAKELLTLCLEAELPALLDRHSCGAGGCGCAPKLALLVRPDDVPRVAALLDDRWRAMLEREGTLEPAPAADAETACPACGTTAPLVEGACSSCGLQLA